MSSSPFEHIRKLGGKKYQDFLNADYREWNDNRDNYWLLQKAIIDTDNLNTSKKLFFINVWVIDWSEYRDRSPLISFQADAQFNTRNSDRENQYPCFNVTLLDTESRSPKEIEDFFLDIFRKLDCLPYDA